MTKFLNKAKEIIFKVSLVFTGAWLAIALSFQLYAMFLLASGQEQEMTRISNEISWRIDGTYKNNPDNIWYEGNKNQ
jgi:hypothetical protein